VNTLGLALLLGLIAASGSGRQPAAEKPSEKLEFYRGKVVPLAGLLEKFGSRLDPEAAPHWLALVTDDGKTYPLVKDAGGQAFFKDPRLQDRLVRIGGRLLGDTRLLQVLSINTYVKGELREVYYWCETCAIRREALPKQCECCGSPMELREVPLKK
jgi:hypothetical protein